jgi:hypothetical protein
MSSFAEWVGKSDGPKVLRRFVVESGMGRHPPGANAGKLLASGGILAIVTFQVAVVSLSFNFPGLSREYPLQVPRSTRDCGY